MEENSIMRLVQLVSATLVLFLSMPAFAQEWIEFSSLEERVSCLFPSQPRVTETAWVSEYGAVLPSRVYSVTQGQNRYSLTVVDYNPVERLLVEKSKACPAGTETCQGIGDCAALLLERHRQKDETIHDAQSRKACNHVKRMVNEHENPTELLLNISRIRFRCCRDITPKAGCHRQRCQGA
jgi:hypothetical protein